MPLPLTLLDLLALGLATIHFGTPLTYYWYLRRRWLPRPWNVRRDPGYAPRIAVIVPTYNEAGLIERKLDNLYEQDYPRDRLEIMVVDSASTDGTLEKVRVWAKRHPDVRLVPIEEPVRRGKAHALNTALKHVSSDVEIVVVTDADSLWPQRDTLRRVASYFADPIVGAVSCLKQPEKRGSASVEESYRSYYNLLRLAESKAWSTPVFHGELAAFRKKLLEKLGGFPTDLGADDSHTATLITLAGYRAITPEDLLCIEIVPREHYHLWRIRRAQHLIQHFWRVLVTKPKTPREFKPILYAETFLHLANPWILPAAVALLITSAITSGSLLALMLLTLGLLSQIYKPYRMWVVTQLYLVAASMRNLWTKEIVWRKQVKH